jgi:hypothetical protein
MKQLTDYVLLPILQGKLFDENLKIPGVACVTEREGGLDSIPLEHLLQRTATNKRDIRLLLRATT